MADWCRFLCSDTWEDDQNQNKALKSQYKLCLQNKTSLVYSLCSLFLRASGRYFSLQIIPHPRASAIVTCGVRLATRSACDSYNVVILVARLSPPGIKYDQERPRGIVKHSIWKDGVFYCLDFGISFLFISPPLHICILLFLREFFHRFRESFYSERARDKNRQSHSWMGLVWGYFVCSRWRVSL